jgi:hypothetical protein
MTVQRRHRELENRWVKIKAGQQMCERTYSEHVAASG